MPTVKIPRRNGFMEAHRRMERGRESRRGGGQGQLGHLGELKQEIRQYLQMGSVIFRNRYWYYKSLYDDYIGRQMRMAFGLTTLIWLPHYWYGVHLNRTLEQNASHKNYFVEWNPRRNRLTHNLIFEEFQIVLENWMKLEQEYQENGGKLLHTHHDEPSHHDLI